MKATNKQLIGLNTYLFTFPFDCLSLFRTAKEEMSKQGTVTEVFLNNELGFELKLFTKI